MTSEEKIKLIDLAEQFERTGKKREAMEIYSKIPDWRLQIMNIMMSEEEKTNLLNLYRQLKANGKDDEAFEVSKRIPLAPHLAMALKEVCGVEHVKNSGFNLIDAEAKYGKDWLDQ